MNPTEPAGAAGTPPALPAPKTSLLAVLSLLFGILGCTIIGALAGIACGIIGLVRINRSGGLLKGAGLAIAGIVVSCLMLLSTPILAGMLLPALAKAKAKAQIISSVNNLKQLGLAARIHSVDNDGKLPPADNWRTTLAPLLGDNAGQVLRRPANPGAECGYGYNAAVAGKNESDVNPATVLFFELEMPACDAVGGPELLRRPRPGDNVIVVGRADGSVWQVRGEDLSSLRWQP